MYKRFNRNISLALFLPAPLILSLALHHLGLIPWHGWLNLVPQSTHAWISAIYLLYGVVALPIIAARWKTQLRAKLKRTNYCLCVECGYELPQDQDQGRCPECGSRYWLNDVRDHWAQIR